MCWGGQRSALAPSGQRPTRPAPHEGPVRRLQCGAESDSACPTEAGLGHLPKSAQEDTPLQGLWREDSTRPTPAHLQDEDGCSRCPLPYHHQLCRRPPDTTVSLPSLLPKVGWLQTHPRGARSPLWWWDPAVCWHWAFRTRQRAAWGRQGP